MDYGKAETEGTPDQPGLVQRMRNLRAILDKVVAVRPQDCICCKLCELRCPDLAIEVITEQE
jgi:NAD-dependent dihydropyrimidine dehydrogenase PreA subunit